MLIVKIMGKIALQKSDLLLFPIFLDRSNTGEVAPGTGPGPWGR